MSARPVPRTNRPGPDVARADRRWLLLSVTVFAVSMVVLLGGLALYHATGSHPTITLLKRQLKAIAKWIIPHHRRVRWGWW